MHAVLVVEGKTDARAVRRVVHSNVAILQTYGTMSEYDMEQLLEPYESEPLFTMFDRDRTGDRLRAQCDALFFEAVHLVPPEPNVEVAETPPDVLRLMVAPYHALSKKDWL